MYHGNVDIVIGLVYYVHSTKETTMFIPNRTMIPQERILHIIERMMRFPHPTVCRHLVAADLLSLLGEYGFPVSQELAKAVVGADDEKALELLRQ